MESKPSYYSIIPASVRYDKSLSPNEKLFYGEITALSNKDGFCWASNNYFSNLYDVHPTRISKWISNLSKSGHIVVESDDKTHHNRKIYITKGQPPLSERATPLVLKGNAPLVPKGNHNIKDINIKKEYINNDFFSDEVKDIFAYWKNIMGSVKAVLDKKRSARIEWALKTYGIEDCKDAILGCSKSKWHMGENTEGKVFNCIELIFRDAEHFEKFFALRDHFIKRKEECYF